MMHKKDDAKFLISSYISVRLVQSFCPPIKKGDEVHDFFFRVN